MFPQIPQYLVQRSRNQCGSGSQNWKCHRAVWRPLDFSEKTQAEVVWARHTVIWTGHDYPTGNSPRREMRQTEDTNIWTGHDCPTGSSPRKEMRQTEDTNIWTGHDCPTGNSPKREMTRQTEETMGRHQDNMKEWTGLEWNLILRKDQNSKKWRKLVVKSTVVPQRSDRLRDRWDEIRSDCYYHYCCLLLLLASAAALYMLIWYSKSQPVAMSLLSFIVMSLGSQVWLCSLHSVNVGQVPLCCCNVTLGHVTYLWILSFC